MNHDYKQLVFSGGGTRCFWHGGFMEVASQSVEFVPERVSGCSGGALSAAAWIGRREQRLLDVMGDAFDRNGCNIDPDSSNYTPHQEIYRQVVSDTLDTEAISNIVGGPAFQIALGRPPKALPERVGAALAVALYEADQQIRSTPHMRLTKAVGIELEMVDARQAANEGTLVDLICAAATIPPVFDIPHYGGRPTVDGGTLDKAPLPQPDLGPTLLLLTRQYRNIPQVEGRTYVQPSRPVDADKIDFTERHKIQDTWDQGRADAERWLQDGAT